MKLHKFRASDKDQENWTILQQLNTFTSGAFTLNGFNQGFCYGYLSYDGPRVHVYLWIYGAPDWEDDAYIILPAPPVRLYPLGVPADFDQFIGPIIDVDTGQPINDQHYKVTTGLNDKCHIVFPTAGSITNSGTLSGSYIRN